MFRARYIWYHLRLLSGDWYKQNQMRIRTISLTHLGISYRIWKPRCIDFDIKHISKKRDWGGIRGHTLNHRFRRVSTCPWMSEYLVGVCKAASFINTMKTLMGNRLEVRDGVREGVRFWETVKKQVRESADWTVWVQTETLGVSNTVIRTRARSWELRIESPPQLQTFTMSV